MDGKISEVAAAAVAALEKSKEQVTDVNAELILINRTLGQLEEKLLLYGKKIDDNLKRRDDILHDFCQLILVLEKPLMIHDRVENALRNLEETLSLAWSDSDDDDESETDRDRERRRILEEIREIQEDVVRAEKRVHVTRKICAHIEPHFNRQRTNNETLHAKLWEKFGKIARVHREMIARRELLLVTMTE